MEWGSGTTQLGIRLGGASLLGEAKKFALFAREEIRAERRDRLIVIWWARQVKVQPGKHRAVV